ncbi:hypothetical protein L596_016459 [Steinernema carpocapsae]|uniref:Uncharacterized protein n=1 Tax=Steinernema carpocapsae TaxID=34508 RepID=A0A4U5NJ08_STECR|nr:hypothetical protein L596_016459 [Steinernema carpocapsae]
MSSPLTTAQISLWPVAEAVLEVKAIAARSRAKLFKFSLIWTDYRTGFAEIMSVVVPSATVTRTLAVFCSTFAHELPVLVPADPMQSQTPPPAPGAPNPGAVNPSTSSGPTQPSATVPAPSAYKPCMENLTIPGEVPVAIQYKPGNKNPLLPGQLPPPPVQPGAADPSSSQAPGHYSFQKVNDPKAADAGPRRPCYAARGAFVPIAAARAAANAKYSTPRFVPPFFKPYWNIMGIALLFCVYFIVQGALDAASYFSSRQAFYVIALGEIPTAAVAIFGIIKKQPILIIVLVVFQVVATATRAVLCAGLIPGGIGIFAIVMSIVGTALILFACYPLISQNARLNDLRRKTTALIAPDHPAVAAEMGPAAAAPNVAP